MLDGVSVVARVLIASFAVDRIASGIMFLFPIAKSGSERGVDTHLTPKRIAYFAIAGLVGGVAIAYYGGVKIFHALGISTINDVLDTILTGLILMAGADCIGTLLRKNGAAGAQVGPKPIEITGTLLLDDTRSKKTSNGSD